MLRAHTFGMMSQPFAYCRCHHCHSHSRCQSSPLLSIIAIRRRLLHILPLKLIEYGFGYVIIRSPNTPYSIDLRGTIHSFKMHMFLHYYYYYYSIRTQPVKSTSDQLSGNGLALAQLVRKNHSGSQCYE